MKWYIKDNNFVIEQFYKIINIVIIIILITLFFIIFGILSVFLVYISVNFISNLEESLISLSNLFLSFIFFIYLIALFYLFKKDLFFYKPFVVIERYQQRIKFYNNKNTMIYDLALNKVSYIYDEHYVEESWEGSDYFNSYLVKKDGSILKINEIVSENKDTYIEFIDQITRFTGLSNIYKEGRLNQIELISNIKSNHSIYKETENLNFIKEKKNGNQIIFLLNKKPYFLVLAFFAVIFTATLIGMIIYLKKTVFIITIKAFFGVLLVLFVFALILYFIYFIFELIFSPFPYKSTLIVNSDGIQLKKRKGIWIQNKVLKKEEIININLNRKYKNYKFQWSIDLFFKSGESKDIQKIEIFSIPEKFIGKNKYYHKNLLYEFESLISKIVKFLGI